MSGTKSSATYIERRTGPPLNRTQTQRAVMAAEAVMKTREMRLDAENKLAGSGIKETVAEGTTKKTARVKQEYIDALLACIV